MERSLIDAVKDDVPHMIRRFVEEYDWSECVELQTGDFGYGRHWRFLYTGKSEEKYFSSPAISRLDEIDFYDEYGEPGYELQEGQRGIATGNWNSIDLRFYYKDRLHPGSDAKDCLPERIARILEWAGYELEWDDEWMDIETGDGVKLFRISPDGYDWTPSYVEMEGEFYGKDDIKKDPRDYLSWLTCDHTRANKILSDEELRANGYVSVVERMETGFHAHQTDSPKKVAEELGGLGLTSYIFSIDGKGQFDISWSAWVLASEIEEDGIDLKEFEGINTRGTGPSIAEQCKEGLKNAAASGKVINHIPIKWE